MAASPKNQEIYDLLAIFQKLDLKTPEPETVISARIAQERIETEHKHVTELREVRHRERWDYFVVLAFLAAGAFCSVVIYKTHPPATILLAPL
ncbi:MAG: hypothetical protein ACHRXM_20185 [Isosphaerales bacterium]